MSKGLPAILGQKCLTQLLCLLASVAGLASWIAFNGLGAAPINDWDEARQGLNALEMLRSGDYLVTTYQGSPDYWNVKPPLAVWATTVAYQLFGATPFALRFVSALSLPLCAVITAVFLWRRVGAVAAFFGGACWAVTGANFPHLFRSGDPDALLILLSLCSCVCLYEGLSGRPRWLILAGVSMALAFLAKSFHVVTLVAATASAWLLCRRQVPLRRFLLLHTLPCIALVGAWVVARYLRDGAAFFRLMLELDLLNRVTTVVEGHTDTGLGKLYYVKMLSVILGPEMRIALVTLATGAMTAVILARKTVRVDLLLVVIFGGMLVWNLALFSSAKTYLTWYAYPAVIGAFVLAGYALQLVVDAVVASPWSRTARAIAIGLVVLILAPALVVNGATQLTVQHQSAVTPAIDASRDGYRRVYLVDAEGRITPPTQSMLLGLAFADLQVVPSGLPDALSDVELAWVALPEHHRKAFEAYRPDLAFWHREQSFAVYRPVSALPSAAARQSRFIQ